MERWFQTGFCGIIMMPPIMTYINPITVENTTAKAAEMK